MKKMFKNLFYRFRSESSVRFSDFFRYIEILKEYNKFETLPGKDEIAEEDELLPVGCNGRLSAFKSKTDNIFELYFGNIRIHILDDTDNKVVQIFLKKQGVPWCLPRKGNSFDESNPSNRSIEIYKWFDVTILGESGFVCEKYKQGVWDKEISREMKTLKNIINGFTDEEHIKKSFLELESNVPVKVEAEERKYVDIKNIKQ